MHAAVHGVETEATTRSLGAAVFAVGLAAIAAQNFIASDFVTELQPVPAGIAGRTMLAYLNGALLLAATASVLLNFRVRLAAMFTTLLLAVWIVFLHVPRVIAHPNAGNAWTPALEIFAMLGAALMIVEQRPAPKIGLLCFAVTLLPFGALHFIYWEYVASVIPAWIPGHTFWAYFTGVAHVAAGIAIIVGVVSPAFRRVAVLAAGLWALMTGLWVVLLHVPRALAHIDTRPEWTSLFVAITLCGGGLLVRQTLIRSGSAR
ncbi:MAG TPA: hypothetical protein VGQ22_03705 [Steroidobacteraceae bacterium]|jgi:uncharacterized membrane protein|nr:hypothetical protein [Steroidobacteraceae bacterium]